MKDTDCIAFLQWALPRMHLRWPGFRKVRRQVCRRIQRRLQILGLSDLRAYRDYLKRHTEEWSVLDHMTPITISSFYRDKAVWDFLWHEVLEQLAAGESGLRAWTSVQHCPMKPSTSSCAETWFLPILMNRCSSKPWRGYSRDCVTVGPWLSGGVSPCRQTFPN